MAWKLEHIPRGSNEKADSLAVVAASLPIKEYQPKSSIVVNRVNKIEKAYPS